MGAKNKKEKDVKKVDLEPLCLTYQVPSYAGPCLSKGNEKALI